MKKNLWWLFAALFTLVAILFFLATSITKKSPTTLTIAAGREGGTYYQHAKALAKELEKDGFIKIHILESAGSIQNLSLLEEEEADIAFVQGGCANEKNREDLRTIAALYFEPLWLFYNASLPPISYLKDIQPLRFSIGEEGSGTKALVETLLHINEINSSTNPKKLSSKKAYLRLKEGKIDAFFTVLSPNSSLIHTILSDHNISVASFRRAQAYQKRYSYLKSLQIPEGSLDLKNNIPAQDLSLLTTTASLVVNKNLDDARVRFITIKVKEMPTFQGFDYTKYIDIPMHPAAQKYLTKGESILEKIFPYWIASNIDRLKYLLIPILTLLIPIIKGILPLYKWRIRSKIYTWYDDLEKIEKSSLQGDDIAKNIQQLQLLQAEVNAHTDVPLSYMGELYALKLHIDNVMVRLERLRKA